MTKTLHEHATGVHSEEADAVLVTSPHGEIAQWSAGAERLFGYGPTEATGRTLRELLVPLDRSDEEESLRAHVLANGSALFESVLRRKDGTLLQAELASRVIDFRGASAISYVLKDVTRLRVLRDARRVQARLGDVLETLPDGVVLVNASGHIVYANMQLAQLFGYAPEALPGRPADELLPPELRGGHLRAAADADAPRARREATPLRALRLLDPLRQRIRYTLELRGLRRDGSEFPIEISLSALRLETSVMVMSAIRDITARKRAEDELRRKNIELAQANRAKDRFLATMSHELRTPLNAILGFTGMLLMERTGPLNADQARQLRTVEQSGRHLLALIEDLLDVARIESGTLRLERSEMACNAVVEGVAATLRPQADAKQVALRVEVPAASLPVLSNQRGLNQILLNLVQNAIKFTERGAVEIKVERVAHARADGGDEVAIHVVDTGPGIRREDLPRLFQPFTQLDNGTARRHEGAGLGLHLSQKLASLLDASITCESEPGHGSAFTLHLPVPK